MDIFSIKFLWPFIAIEALTILLYVPAFIQAQKSYAWTTGKVFNFVGGLVGAAAVAPFVLPVLLYKVISDKFGSK